MGPEEGCGAERGRKGKEVDRWEAHLVFQRAKRRKGLWEAGLDYGCLRQGPEFAEVQYSDIKVVSSTHGPD